MTPVRSFAAAGSSWWAVEGSTPLLLVILLAGVGTGVLFAVSLAAYARRGGRRLLLVSLAIGALWGRSIVGAGTVLGYVPMPAHHYLEHTLDFAIAATVLYAVYAHAPGESVADDRSTPARSEDEDPGSRERS
ncbi:MAG: hypothetical protein PPP55_01970 [Halorubrum sp.]